MLTLSPIPNNFFLGWNLGWCFFFSSLSFTCVCSLWLFLAWSAFFLGCLCTLYSCCLLPSCLHPTLANMVACVLLSALILQGMHLHHNLIIDSETQSWLLTCKSCWPVICLHLPDYYLINSTPHTHVHRPIDFLLHTPLQEEVISWLNECLTSLTGFFLYCCFWKKCMFHALFSLWKMFSCLTSE